MKVKIIPIILLLLISVATPVVVSMAIPKTAKPFYVVATMDPYLELDDEIKGVQKYSQEGTIIDDDDNTGTIFMRVSITNFYKAFEGKYARAIVHFTMDFDDEERPDVRGIIVGKIWFTFDPLTQHVKGKFVGRGSHVQGTISLIGSDPNILEFSGKEW